MLTNIDSLASIWPYFLLFLCVPGEYSTCIRCHALKTGIDFLLSCELSPRIKRREKRNGHMLQAAEKGGNVEIFHWPISIEEGDGDDKLERWYRRDWGRLGKLFGGDKNILKEVKTVYASEGDMAHILHSHQNADSFTVQTIARVWFFCGN